jgi:mono/diheme cytochrome c family protein
MHQHLISAALAVVLAIGFTPRAMAQAPAPAAAESLAAVAVRQVEVGEQWYRSACITCHAVTVVSNDDFRLKWQGRSAFELFERIRSTMPASKPGSLSSGTYAAIVAYLMKLNGMPVGARPVRSDSVSLSHIRLALTAASH